MFVDSAARDVSQLDFDSAMINLNNAESRLLQSDKRIQLLASLRKGSITCNDETAASFDDDVKKTKERSDAGYGSMSSDDSSEGYVMAIGISLSVSFAILGIIIGVYRGGWGRIEARSSASMSKSLLFHRNR